MVLFCLKINKDAVILYILKVLNKTICKEIYLEVGEP